MKQNFSQYYKRSLTFTRVWTLFMVFVMTFSGAFTSISIAKEEEPPEEYRGESMFSAEAEGLITPQEESFGIAWGDPDGPHSVYDWPYTFDQMGLVIQSYQNYSSGTSSAYFHHGIDMVAPNGTQVFTRSGGQVVNIENYRPGNELYWEVAILDPEGYVWQYHHIDEPTIPQLIYDKFAEWQANPDTGGYIPPNTHIGNIIYWPVVSLGYRFNHIHLNILGAGDKYLNTLEFHTPLVDSQVPEIQEIGLLNGDTVVSGTTASGNYGLYVRARDLFMSPVYYLPPYKTEFSIDGGEWITVWEFHDLPGGSSDMAYVNDFYVPNYTQGDYEDRDFYIDLGFTTGGQRAFPSAPGQHTIDVRVWDYYGNSDIDTFTWTVVSSIPDNGCSSGNGVTRTFNFTEDLIVTDVNLGINLSHASRGQIRVTLKSPSDASGTVIINNSSDTYDNYDVWVDDTSGSSINDGNNDNVSEPYFDRTAGPSTNGALDSFNGKTTFGEWTVFVCDNTGGTTGTVNQINLDVQGYDNDNTQPIADPQIVETVEDTDLDMILTGFDADGDPLTFTVVSGPNHGSLTGSAPNLTYIPDPDYFGSDSFNFVVNDGAVNSQEATVSINVIPVNDAPVASPQSVSGEYNTSLPITLSGADVDGDPLTYNVLTGPLHGVLSGTLPNLVYTPNTGYSGSDSFDFIASDGSLDSASATVSITVNPPGPVTVFFDDFESNLGWDEDPYGNDSATIGNWERANPEGTDYNGAMQLGTTVSGTYDLVTGPLAGSSVGSYDVDGGVTSILSPSISLPAGRELTLSFSYYLAHLNNASSDDYLRVSILGNTTQLLLQELGSGDNDIASWENFTADISSFAGQTVRILIVAADAGSGSLIEAAVDDVLVEGVLTNNPPSADPQSVGTDEDVPVGITLTGSDPDGDALTFQLNSNPSHGVLSGVGQNLTYTPNANFNGLDSFTFMVSDGTVSSSPATVNITVASVNDIPVANPQSVSTDENTPVSITLSGFDIDEDSLVFAILGSPLHGSLSGTMPNLTYTPDSGYEGADSFTFTVSDGQLTSNPATVAITVNPINDPPTANNQAVATDEDTAVGLTLTGTDPEGQSLDYAVLTQPANGILSGVAPDLTYTPDANYHGADSFTFKVNDGELDSATGTVSITVNSVNDLPVAENQAVTVSEDGTVEILLSGSDVDNDVLAYSVIVTPSHGSLSGTAPVLTYTPDPDYFGQDSLTFSVNDGQADSTEAIVSITVNAVNDQPVADGQSVSTDEDMTVSIMLTGSDVEGSDLTFFVSDEPNNGSLSGVAPDLIYTPDADYYGTDSFRFVVNDGEVDSASALVNITVNAVNDVPIADEQTVGTTEDTPVAITLTGSDVDEDELSFDISTGPLHGTLSGTAPYLTYTPDASYQGADSFTFVVSDGEATSAPATINIMINEVNDAPIANSQSVTTDEDTGIEITLTGSDPEGLALNFEVLSQPSYGTLSGTAPNLTYTPDDNFFGDDSFTFKVNDGALDSDLATIGITVRSVNDAPIAISQSVSGDEDGTLGILLSGTDVENDDLLFSVVGGPNHGSLSGTSPNLVYTPQENFFGSDSFTFVVNDGQVDSALATVTISINPVNDAPVADGQSISTNEDTDALITLTGSDVEGSTLSYIVVNEPINGSLTGTTPNLTYTPDANFNGSDSFTFLVNDGEVNSTEAVVSITVDAVNDVPVADGQTVFGNEDMPISITLTGSDIEGSALSFNVETQPAHGALNGSAPDLTYTPDANFFGMDSFTFSVSDGALSSVTAIVEISVSPVNDVPAANAQSVSTDEDIPVSITLTGSDIEGSALTFEVDQQPDHGVLSGDGPDLTYTPDSNYFGTDSFTFKVNDGTLESAPATVQITIAPINDTPVADPKTVSTEQGTPISITLTGSDIDGDDLTFAVTINPLHGVLNGVAPDLTYTPDSGYEGQDSFSFTVSDGQVTSTAATVTITVNPSGPLQVFFDDFESDLGWALDPYADDTATTGQWKRAIPEAVDYSGLKQLGVTVSGIFDLVTGPLAGRSAGDYDIDGGVTSMLSPQITLPEGRELELTFSYYLAHATNSSTDDFFRVSVVGESSAMVFESLGRDADVDAVWQEVRVNLSSFGGQTIAILVQAADAGSASLVEAGVDDVRIVAQRPNTPPTADPKSINLSEDSSTSISLSGSDADGDTLSYQVVVAPQNGSLSGVLPELTYIPDQDFNGSDQFSYVVNDGIVSSDPAVVDIEVIPVNDAPVAEPQSVITQTGLAVEITLKGSDIDGDGLNYILVSQPAHGSLTGSAPDLLYTPETGYVGEDGFTFKVTDGDLESVSALVNITVTSAGPVTVFFDDFETNKGWNTNPFATDSATSGIWERAIPGAVNYNGDKQIPAYSGSYDLVTGALSGTWWNAGRDDIDSGLTSIRSPEILLPNTSDLMLSFKYYFAHASNSSTADFLRVTIVGSESLMVFEELGDSDDDDAVWETFTVNLNAFAGQTVFILIEAADNDSGSLVEAAVDDVLIIAE